MNKTNRSLYIFISDKISNKTIYSDLLSKVHCQGKLYYTNKFFQFKIGKHFVIHYQTYSLDHYQTVCPNKHVIKFSIQFQLHVIMTPDFKITGNFVLSTKRFDGPLL